MINRREFVTGLAAAGLTTRFFASDRESKIEVGLELYSLREDMNRDVPGTLARIRQMGFGHVEVPSLYGLTALEFCRALDKAGLNATAMVALYADHDRRTAFALQGSRQIQREPQKWGESFLLRC